MDIRLQSSSDDNDDLKLTYIGVSYFFLIIMFFLPFMTNLHVKEVVRYGHGGVDARTSLIKVHWPSYTFTLFVYFSRSCATLRELLETLLNTHTWLSHTNAQLFVTLVFP